MGWIILIVLLLVLAYVLYLGKKSREQRKFEEAREAEKLEAQVDDHRSMSETHQEKAAELRDKADREMTKAARHEVIADELVGDGDPPPDDAR